MLSRRSLLRGGLGCACAGLVPFRSAAQHAPSAPVWSRASVMLWTLAKLGSFDERLDIVARAGYHNVELVDEFRNWSDAEFARVQAKLKSLALRVDAMAGLRTGFADPSGADAFLADLGRMIAVADRLSCPQLILLSGPVRPGIASEAQHEASIATLQRAVPLLAKAGVTGVIEPIDRIENPTIYLDGVTEAFAITRAVASPQVKVLYDLYHEQRTHGNLIEKLENNIAEVGLIHVADVPGRHEPGSGELDYGAIYRTLKRLRYPGVVAMEFYPSGDPAATLRQAREALEQDTHGLILAP